MQFVDFGAMDFQAQQPPPGGRPPGPAPAGMVAPHVGPGFVPSVGMTQQAQPATPPAPKSNLLWWLAGLVATGLAIWYIDKEEKKADGGGAALKANDPEEEEDPEEDEDAEDDGDEEEQAA